MHRRRLEGWLFVGNGNLDGDGLALPDVIGNGDSKAVFADKALNRLITAGAVCVQAKRAVEGQECDLGFESVDPFQSEFGGFAIGCFKRQFGRKSVQAGAGSRIIIGRHYSISTRKSRPGRRSGSRC